MKALGQEIERQLNVDSNNLNFESFHFPVRIDVSKMLAAKHIYPVFISQDLHFGGCTFAQGLDANDLL